MLLSGLLALLAGRAFAAPPLDDADEELDDADEELDLEDVLDEIDGELSRTTFDAGAALTEASLAATTGLVDVPSLHDMQARRASPWGRIDVSIVWRRIERTDEPHREEIVVVATWRH